MSTESGRFDGLRMVSDGPSSMSMAAWMCRDVSYFFIGAMDRSSSWLMASRCHIIPLIQGKTVGEKKQGNQLLPEFCTDTFDTHHS